MQTYHCSEIFRLGRQKDSENRPRAFANLSKTIQKVMMFIDLHSKGDEKYAHLSAEEAAKAGAAAVEAQAWMEKHMNEQVKIPRSHLTCLCM